MTEEIKLKSGRNVKVSTEVSQRHPVEDQHLEVALHIDAMPDRAEDKAAAIEEARAAAIKKMALADREVTFVVRW